MELAFEKYTPPDFHMFRELVKDDEIMRYISGKGLTSKQAEDKFNAILEINATPHLGYFKVISLDRQLFLGDCKLVSYKKDPSVFEIGYLLQKRFWGQGIGTKICESMLAMASRINAQKDIVGIIDPDNAASRALLVKFGFESFFLGVEDDVPTEKLILKRT
ncbi:GNAT family N-acetyltransferase [Sphingobacterium thalpophilum]|uniref:GNAT family N-acetyltransferase n=1 Tax=Sphingobacterium thalpophilum TaxID=259 RepID=UPI002D79EDE7|nr:GNAT family N-acetyltransferase [Sphingobacterium thalpophilum]